MPYTESVKFTTTGNYGCGPDDEDDVYTIAEFLALCATDMFVDYVYDSYGHPVREQLSDPDIFIHPSRPQDIPADATHIVWFNK